jgi:putative transposase
MPKFRNKYRIESTRLKKWDYSMPGAYFVTIVTNNRENLFGEIKNNKIILNAADEFAIMPNHVHGIILIIENIFYNNKNNSNTLIVETQNFASLRKSNKQSQTNSSINKFGPQSKNLGSIIRGFKIGVTKWYRERGINQKIWQSRFHDHIIRNENELNQIRQYIINNPSNWKEDEHNKP